ncbi:hypothetical protein L4X63_05280 [Geomonas sp. Red32]|uniref:hypothetical protein n=1 Tax=Geomonas sp. Red32 TaxID=2912856 RepID=UPI00202D034F|nr:hypothetical protein [Geomonas sp. Red32]MCM0080995.1 hypothetical protein [Geomonas sp. Red32]
MRVLDSLERKLGRFAIPNLTIYLIAGQSLFYVMYMTGKLDPSATLLSADRLMAGEWWRIAALPFDPPRQSLLFALFAWYFFYLLGSALEAHWGAFRYNAFLLLGCLITIAASFLVPHLPVGNTFLAGSVFLAFATLFPDYQILLFFVLPVRIKWLAILTWAGYGYLLLFGGWAARVSVLAATGNYLIFFARDIVNSTGYRRRSFLSKAALPRRERDYHHRCTVCGITDRTHPDMDFRYCPQCNGQYGYCREHIFRHEHKK